MAGDFLAEVFAVRSGFCVHPAYLLEDGLVGVQEVRKSGLFISRPLVADNDETFC
ncbi:MAG: hypothetical protein ACJA0J_000183, partial [Bdellovibrionota bacterium]